MNPGQQNEDAVLASVSLSEIQKNLVMSVEYICGAGVEGDVAEFGTNTGTTAAVLARSLRFFAPPQNGRTNCKIRKRLHLFDSFKGLPPSTNETDQQSPHVQAGVWREGI